jgi:hypothetical protein
MNTNPIDSISIGLIFILFTVMMVAFIEAGFRLGQVHQGKPNKSQMAQVRAIMGASLGLLAFMLAFSFSIAQSHFEARAQAYLLELNAINAVYRSAGLLDDNQEFAARDLVRQFVDSRIELQAVAADNRAGEAERLLSESNRIQSLLWRIAEETGQSGKDENSAGTYVGSVLAMIQASNQRVQATLFNRIPLIIWVTLSMMALLSMIVMGYQAGLTGTRSRLATWTLAIAFSAVMALVIDLDRPRQSLFSLNQQTMKDYQEGIYQHMEQYEPAATGDE